LRQIDPDADLSGLLSPAWADIQARHPELPACVFEPQPKGMPDRMGSIGGIVGMVAPPGHQRPDGTTYRVLTIVVYPGWLLRAAWESLQTLMHEAIHVLDHVRHGEVSGHGDVFAALGRELGMATRRDERDGEVCYNVLLTPELRDQYAEAISALHARGRELGAASWVI
jgi:hypothetical protein